LAGKTDATKEADGVTPENGTKLKQKAKSDGSIDKDT
jgi:hypothetical protein